MSRLRSASPTFASPSLIICVAVRMCAVNKRRWCSRVMRPSPEFVFFSIWWGEIKPSATRDRVIIHRRSQQEQEFGSVCAEFRLRCQKKKKTKLFLKTKSILHLGWDNIWEWGANYHTPFDLCCMQCPNFIWIGVGLVRCRFFAAYRALPLNQEEFGGTDTKTRGD